MSLDLNQLETRLWAAADQLWANTGLKPSEFSNPVLGLIFLRYAEKRFHEAEARMIDSGLDAAEIEKIDYQAEGALFLPDNARFSYLLDLAEGQDLGKAVNEAMAAVEAENEELIRTAGADSVVVYADTAGRLLGVSALSPATGADGAQVAIAVLLYPVNATLADAVPADAVPSAERLQARWMRLLHQSLPLRAAFNDAVQAYNFLRMCSLGQVHLQGVG